MLTVLKDAGKDGADLEKDLRRLPPTSLSLQIPVSAGFQGVLVRMSLITWSVVWPASVSGKITLL